MEIEKHQKPEIQNEGVNERLHRWKGNAKREKA